jgi:Na+-transporting NADH:ubiquinone oxidoreductase subunit A
MIKINKGLTLPIKGQPEQVIYDTKHPQTIAVLGRDYLGVRPAMAVKVGDRVRAGQLLFSDKNSPAVRFTSPGTGVIKAIHRGERRVLLSVVITLDGDEQVAFSHYSISQMSRLKREQIIERLLASGLWTALRTRPYSKVANPDRAPHSIFITAMDSNPLAPAIAKILQGREQDFVNGVGLISRLTDGNVFLCKSPETALPDMDIQNLTVHDFSGPHPAGIVGTHIHFLDPVRRGKTVWHIGIQDIIAIGRLFTTGQLDMDRIIALAGPSVKQPRLYKTRIGAALDELTLNELLPGEQRIISGSVLSGFHAVGAMAYLGRYHQQVSVLSEYRQRELLGWLNPGLNRFSVKRVVISSFFRGKACDFTTSTHGEMRAIIPSGNYERVMPLDIMPLFLIRALAVEDIEEAENLGCLELDEEDLALCAFVCPSKLEFGPLLRRTLALIEEEGDD